MDDAVVVEELHSPEDLDHEHSVVLHRQDLREGRSSRSSRAGGRRAVEGST